jgi:hypothetical protein
LQLSRPFIGRGRAKRAGIAAVGRALHRRPAGKAEVEELGRLVEGLAEGIVDGGAVAAIGPDVLHRQKLGVAAGDEEQQVGRPQALGQARREGVGFQMVDRHQRQVVGERDRLGRHQPDDQPADEAGTGGGRDAIEIGEAEIGLAQRLGDQAVEMGDMGAGGDLRHDTAVGRVGGVLRQHDVGEHVAGAVGPAAPDDRRGGLVARRLQPQDDEIAFGRGSRVFTGHGNL